MQNLGHFFQHLVTLIIIFDNISIGRRRRSSVDRDANSSRPLHATIEVRIPLNSSYSLSVKYCTKRTKIKRKRGHIFHILRLIHLVLITLEVIKRACTAPGLPTVWPDWAIYWTLRNFLKPLATFNLPKSTTFLGIFCKGVKIDHFSSETIFGQLL